jgi:GntR family transcriptional regulator/MocR family aminotransferase
VLPLARRLALLDWARRHGAYVIEDDYDSEFRYAGRPLEAVQVLDRDGRTLHIGTFSKNLFPSLRLGFLIVPAPLIEPFRATKQLADRHSAMLSQAVLAEFIAAGHFERHLRRMRNANERRRVTLLQAIERELGKRVEVTGNHAGVHLALWLPGVDPKRLDDIVRAARAHDVGVYSLNPNFFGPVDRAGLLLGYENLSLAAIEAGIRRLAGVLRGYL